MSIVGVFSPTSCCQYYFISFVSKWYTRLHAKTDEHIILHYCMLFTFHTLRGAWFRINVFLDQMFINTTAQMYIYNIYLTIIINIIPWSESSLSRNETLCCNSYRYYRDISVRILQSCMFSVWLAAGKEAHFRLIFQTKTWARWRRRFYKLNSKFVCFSMLRYNIICTTMMTTS